MVTATSNPRSDLGTLRTALYSIPADCDYETWWRVGASLKSELGEDGFELWVAWSRQSANPRHQRPDFRACWRSARPGAIGIGTLYHFAKEWGWRGEAPAVRELTPEEKRRRAEQRRREEAERRELAIEAARASHTLIESAVYDVHPYLSAKGFPEEKGLVSTVDYYLPDSRTPSVRAGDLLVPMRNCRTGKLQSVQSVTPEGAKKFCPGGVAAKAVFRIGRSDVVWYCEGYATALSVRAALRRLYRQDSVVVCFSAANVAKVAERGYVVADHDLWKCGERECGHRWDAHEADCCAACGSVRFMEPAGEKCAKATGLPYWLPPEPGDANDWHLQHGVGALAATLREVLNG